MILVRLDEADQGMALLERALMINRASFGVDHPAYAVTLQIIASIYLEQGRFEEAVDAHEQVLRIVEATYRAGSQRTFQAAINLANALCKSGRHREALSTYVRARDMEATIEEAVSSRTARIALRIGDCWLHLKDPRQASLAYQQAVNEYRQLYGHEHEAVRQGEALIAKLKVLISNE